MQATLEEVLTKILEVPQQKAPAVQKAPEVGVVRRAAMFPKLRTIDEKTRTIEFVASTEAVDRYGDIIRTAGWKYQNYLKNPVFLWGHRSGDPPIGKCVDLRIESNPPALVQKIQFADAATYPFAETIFRLYKNGFMRAVSVGFVPLEHPKPMQDKDGKMTGWEFTSQELLELSAVPIPANPEAVARAVKSGDLSEADATRLFTSDQEADDRELARAILPLVVKMEGVIKRLDSEAKAALRYWSSLDPEVKEAVGSRARLLAVIEEFEQQVANLEAEVALRGGGEQISNLDELLTSLVER